MLSIKVSVPIITYNHQAYIATALDSVLMQAVDFTYEIIVGEDCSTDKTREILIDYQKRYPEKIRLLLNDKNIGGQQNAIQTYAACRGEYIASLDGDDYWTSPDKLKKQVNFLEKHPECSICFHDALIVYDDGSKEPTHYRPSQKEFSTAEDLLFDNYIPTCSAMYRRGLLKNTPAWIDNLKMGDWPMYILNSIDNTIGYMNETMAVYRVHSGGIWSMKHRHIHEMAIIELFETLEKHLPVKYTKAINVILRYRNLVLSECFESSNELSNARIYAIKSISKQFLIISNQLLNIDEYRTTSTYSLPDYVTSIEVSRFLKILVRLYVLPIMDSYVPPRIINLIKMIARRCNLNMY